MATFSSPGHRLKIVNIERLNYLHSSIRYLKVDYFVCFTNVYKEYIYDLVKYLYKSLMIIFPV